MAVQVVIADASDLVIAGMQTTLQPHPRWQVAGSARSMDNLWATVALKAPDVVILSERLYSLDILSAVAQLQGQWPHLRLLVTSMRANGWLIQELLAAGVRGYLHKADDLCEHLETALCMVMLDRPYLSPSASTEYLLAMQSAESSHPLTQEARQVLHLLARGLDVGQIAHYLRIDKRRIYWVREKLRRRFGAQTNEHLIHLAAVEGFIYPGE